MTSKMSVDVTRNEGIQKAIDFLNENPTETFVTAARIFGVNASTLRMRRTRSTTQQDQQLKTHGGCNKVLSDIQVGAIQRYI